MPPIFLFDTKDLITDKTLPTTKLIHQSIMTKRNRANTEANDAKKGGNPQKRRKQNSRRKSNGSSTDTTTNNTHRKSSGRSRMWIEQCKKPRKVPKNILSRFILQILISRVELLDDHGCGNTISQDSIEKNNQEESLAAAAAAAAANVPTKQENSLSVELQISAQKKKEEASDNDNIDGCAPEEKDNNDHGDPRTTPFIQVVRLPSAKGDRKVRRYD